MNDVKYQFDERTIKVIIDHAKCPNCRTKACVKGCSLYDRGILRLQNGIPMILTNLEDAKQMGTECLACEHECRLRGLGALKIQVPIAGLDE